MSELAIVLLSGGMDSCVSTAVAARDHDCIAALHVNYGQRTQQRELEAFAAIAAHYQAQHRLVVELPAIAAIGGSSLLVGGDDIPAADLDSENIPSTYVPFRNGQMLALAVAWAEVISARYIYVGAVEQDSSGYPDCRQEFFAAFETAARFGTRPQSQVMIKTPLIEMNKAQIVTLGCSLAAPLQLTWSCYSDEKQACGRCESCLLRLRGFAAAGVTDPIPYQRVD